MPIALERLCFEPFRIDQFVDAQRQYRIELDPQFPLAIRLFSYDGISPPYSLNWHERLELFLPMAGRGTFVMGERRVGFEAGDVLVIDNMRLHGVEEFHGAARKAVVITFAPAFVFTIGSPFCDSLFLAPFYSQPELAEPIVRSTDRLSPSLHDALAKLVGCYFEPSEGLTYRAGCKAFLLETLYVLTSRFPAPPSARAEYLRRQEEARLLGKLQDYLLRHLSERIPVAAACSILGMGESKFAKYFKAATGETFVAYLTRLRVERARQMLEESTKSVAEIAAEVGFGDQSYFDKMFRRHFQRTPRDIRRAPETPAPAPAAAPRAES